MTGNQFLNTPEALLGRSDSKNPATTCRGITSTGRPCRRGLALDKLDERGLDGVVAVLKQGDHIADARYYCWQHKDQADPANSNDSPIKRTQTEIFKLKNRNSIDTLVQRLGISDVTDHTTEPQRPKQRRRKQATRSTSFWQSLCCMTVDKTDDRIEIIRHRKRVEQGRVASVPTLTHASTAQRTNEQYRVAPLRHSATPSPCADPKVLPHIAASLRAELSKPSSQHDEEGYIYIFWLTPTEQQDPGENTARSLLSPKHRNERRLSEVITEYSYNGSRVPAQASVGTRRILLKIGRANNVTRRMNEWQRQCGHRLNLVRWYPHTSSSPMPSPNRKSEVQPLYPDLGKLNRPSMDHRTSSGVSKVSNVKKVEKLIHLELADKQVKQQCAACGREHREWFEIEADEAGIRHVDTVIRRWVAWSDNNTQKLSTG